MPSGRVNQLFNLRIIKPNPKSPKCCIWEWISINQDWSYKYLCCNINLFILHRNKAKTSSLILWKHRCFKEPEPHPGNCVKNREVEGVKKNWPLPELLLSGKNLEKRLALLVGMQLNGNIQFLARNATILAIFMVSVTFLLLFVW